MFNSLSTAGVMHMDQIILDKVIGKYGWQFVLVINTVMNKFQNLMSMKLCAIQVLELAARCPNLLMMMLLHDGFFYQGIIDALLKTVAKLLFGY